jgi:CBS domain-containing protein
VKDGAGRSSKRFSFRFSTKGRSSHFSTKDLDELDRASSDSGANAASPSGGQIVSYKSDGEPATPRNISERIRDCLSGLCTPLNGAAWWAEEYEVQEVRSAMAAAPEVVRFDEKKEQVVARLLAAQSKHNAWPVVDSENKPLGLLLRSELEETFFVDSDRVDKMMDRAPCIVHRRWPLVRAHKLFTSLGLRHLLVTHEQTGKLAGIITRHDLHETGGHPVEGARAKVQTSPDAELALGRRSMTPPSLVLGKKTPTPPTLALGKKSPAADLANHAAGAPAAAAGAPGAAAVASAAAADQPTSQFASQRSLGETEVELVEVPSPRATHSSRSPANSERAKSKLLTGQQRASYNKA